jgi:amidophosphoribosyltransferase
VFAIYAPGLDVARLTFFGLYALQHRGQESAGIAVADDGQITAVRDMGLVSQVFDERTLASLSGQAAIGHVRYSTTGATSWQNAQPLVRSAGAVSIAVGQNGNLVNSSELRGELREAGTRFGGTTDTELMAALIAAGASAAGAPAASGPASNDRTAGASGADASAGLGEAASATDGLDAAVRDAVGRMRGAFSVTVLAPHALYAFRDPWGIRPLALGDLDGNPVVASESCAFDIVGARLVREIEPGEILKIDEHGLHSERAEVAGARPALDIFEFIYFARPDSRLYGRTLAACREEMGRRLAREAPVAADLVMPVPESGVPAAIGYAQASGIPYGEGLIKNHYVHRTFIQPDQHLRQLGIRMKLNPVPALIEGKRLVVVDDSIVRGNTTSRLVALLKEAGASEVHVRVSSPPVVCPSFYGIDTPNKAELIAAGRSVDEVRRVIGADSLSYLSLEGLQQAIGLPAELFTREGFTCEYPVPIPNRTEMDKLRFERGAA